MLILKSLFYCKQFKYHSKIHSLPNMVSAKKATTVDLELNMIRLLLQRLMNSESGTKIAWLYWCDAKFREKRELVSCCLEYFISNTQYIYEFVSCLGLAVTLISSTCTYEDGCFIVRYKSLLITMLTMSLVKVEWLTQTEINFFHTG